MRALSTPSCLRACVRMFVSVHVSACLRLHVCGLCMRVGVRVHVCVNGCGCGDVGVRVGLAGVQEVWQEVLRCVSRWELLQQMTSGGPTDAFLFSSAPDPSATVKKKGLFSRVTPVTPRHHDGRAPIQPLSSLGLVEGRALFLPSPPYTSLLVAFTKVSTCTCHPVSSHSVISQEPCAALGFQSLSWGNFPRGKTLKEWRGKRMERRMMSGCWGSAANGKAADSFTSLAEAPLNLAGRTGKSGEVMLQAPPEAVLREIDPQEINRMFVRRCDCPGCMSCSAPSFSKALSVLSWWFTMGIPDHLPQFTLHLLGRFPCISSVACFKASPLGFCSSFSQDPPLLSGQGLKRAAGQINRKKKCHYTPGVKEKRKRKRKGKKG